MSTVEQERKGIKRGEDRGWDFGAWWSVGQESLLLFKAAEPGLDVGTSHISEAAELKSLAEHACICNPSWLLAAPAP